MAPVLSRILSPAPLLYSFVIITQFAYGLYLGAQFEFPQAVTLLYAIGLLWAVGWWLRRDSRRRGVLSVYDLGLFLYLAWPTFRKRITQLVWSHASHWNNQLVRRRPFGN